MKSTFNAIARKLLGVKYRKLPRSLLVFAILCVVLYSLDVHFPAAIQVVVLTMTAFTAATILQTLGSEDHSEYLKGFLVLPVDTCAFHLAHLGVVALYVLLTKTAVILSLLLGFCRLTVSQIGLALLAAVLGCLLGFVCFTIRRKSLCLAAVIYIAGHALCFLVFSPVIYLAAGLAGVVLLGLVLVHTDPHAYLIEGGRHRHTAIKVNTGAGPVVVFQYILRFLQHHKNYAANILALLVMAVLFSLIFGELGAGMFLPLGFGILSINTPMAILLSRDKMLRKNIDMLPGQLVAFALPYGGFVTLVNLVVYAVYLMSWAVINGPFSLLYLPAAVIFATQGALLTIYMEWRCPLSNWSVETDLWHNPRKYVVPGLLLVQSVVVAAWWWGIFIAAGFLFMEMGYIAAKK